MFAAMPALLQGVLACPSPEHPEHNVRLTGSIVEVSHVIGMLGLEPDPDDREQIEAVMARGEKLPKGSTLRFRDSHGSLCFLEPCVDAAFAIAQMMGEGGFPTPFD